LGSDYVGVTSAATRRTTEGCLLGVVRFVGMPASGTTPRGIARVNPMDWHTTQRSFIRDTGLELKKRPAMQDGTLRLSSPHPRANVLEIFKRNASLCGLSLPNDAFADRVIHVFGEASLLARQVAQASFCRERSFPLELVSEPSMPHSQRPSSQYADELASLMTESFHLFDQAR
jgi:hypothetical protein